MERAIGSGHTNMPRSQPLALRLAWQLRKEGRKGRLTSNDRAALVASAARHDGNISAVARETRLSRPTVRAVIRDWKASGSIDSPRRGNSGRSGGTVASFLKKVCTFFSKKGRRERPPGRGKKYERGPVRDMYCTNNRAGGRSLGGKNGVEDFFLLSVIY